jgi:hypothetical protein
MDAETLEKLKNNPHYKMSAKQKEELRQLERKPMVEFGVPPVHNTSFGHEVEMEKKKRFSRTVVK